MHLFAARYEHGPAMEIMTPSKEQKIEILEKLGLNLKECKIDEQTMISLTDLLYEYRDVFDVDNPPKDPIPNFSYKIPLKDETPVWKKISKFELTLIWNWKSIF